jgi:formyl-CoA transferase
MVAETEHPVMGTVRTPGQPAKFSRTRPGSARPAPRLGEHTREILAGLGLPDADIDELEKAGVVASYDRK